MNKLIVLGAGESGLGAALLGQQQGYSVFVSDAGKILPETKIIFEEAGIKYEEENHNVNEILAGNLVVKSPGIAENTPVVQAIRNKKELPLVRICLLVYQNAHYCHYRQQRQNNYHKFNLVFIDFGRLQC